MEILSFLGQRFSWCFECVDVNSQQRKELKRLKEVHETSMIAYDEEISMMFPPRANSMRDLRLCDDLMTTRPK